MKTKQYNIKVFEIVVEDTASLQAFIEKNGVLLRNYLLYLTGNATQENVTFLRSQGYDATMMLPLSKPKGERPKKVVQKTGLEILDTIVRSGQELHIEGDLLALKPINSAAKVVCEGNFIGLNRMDGTIVCNGSFMLVRPSAKAVMVFNGVEITESIEPDRYYQIRLQGDEIVVIPYKKDMKWA